MTDSPTPVRTRAEQGTRAPLVDPVDAAYPLQFESLRQAAGKRSRRGSSAGRVQRPSRQRHDGPGRAASVVHFRWRQSVPVGICQTLRGVSRRCPACRPSTHRTRAGHRGPRGQLGALSPGWWGASCNGKHTKGSGSLSTPHRAGTASATPSVAPPGVAIGTFSAPTGPGYRIPPLGLRPPGGGTRHSHPARRPHSARSLAWMSPVHQTKVPSCRGTRVLGPSMVLGYVLWCPTRRKRARLLSPRRW